MRRLGLALALVVVPSGLWGGGGGAAPATDDATIVHVLNRLTWGPRPGDVEAMRAKGLERWIDAQLHPERIDDSAVEKRVAALETHGLSSEELLKGYELPREAKRETQKRRAELGEGASEMDQGRARRELVQKYGSQMQGSPRQVIAELQESKLLRATLSERQLDEVLVDFWLNHFNVYAQKGPVRFLAADHERAIRAHAWGRFEDLLVATAKSPAMLFYLDNWLSADPAAAARRSERVRRFGPRMARRADVTPEEMREALGRRSGLNENYARELLELHTLGVDGGYTQKDVTEVARAFTGWTIRGLRQNAPVFAFDARLHDPADKLVLGRTVKAAGEAEGREILHRLATSPTTARFISWKLARRLVADDPPAALVDRAAATFERTGGEIREVVRTIVTAPEFYAADVRQAKLKTPLEFVVSAVRASGASVASARELAKRVADMGMPLYLQQPPTGYKDTAEAWVSTSGLVARLNFALDLSAGRIPGIELPPSAFSPTPGTSVADGVAARLLPAGLSPSTRATLEAESKDQPTPARVAGLVLGSPEFQRR
jgi:uncharacterized protein (DUF1800 family)